MRKTSIFSIAILIIISLIIIVFKYSTYSDDRIKRIDSFIEYYVKNGFLNGAVLIAEKGEIIYQDAYGIANYEMNIPHQINGKFQIYSISKQFTSLIMLQLVQDGLVDLNEPITKFLKYYRKDTGNKIQIKHLLNHSHGISIPEWNEIPLSLDMQLDGFVENYLSNDLVSEPGTDFSYGSVGRGYVLAAAVIEKVTGKSFETVLNERILEPLGMENSGIFKSNEILPNYVGSYRKSGDSFTKRIDRHHSQKIGASSMYSTINDLFLWDRGLNSNELLSKSLMDEMFTPQIQTSGGMHYGYGVRISNVEIDDNDKKLVWHGGGGVNLICRAIEDNYTIIFLNNVSTDLSLYLAAEEIIKILNDQPYDLIQIHVYDLLRQIIESQGVEKAISHYKYLKSNLQEYYIFNEDELNILGNYFMYYKKYSTAIQIFELNTLEYPKSSKVYDSLGEAYLKNGQNELALKNYTKSLELDPNNANAIEMLKQLK